MTGTRANGRSLARFAARWMQLSLLSRVMLVLSLLSSAAVAVVLGFVGYLFIGGYSGGTSPTNIAPVLFPIALLVLIVAGLPSRLVCGLMWTGYSMSTRRGAHQRGRSPGTRP